MSGEHDTQSHDPAQTRLRADAQRNRDRIVASAKVAFADDGPDVPMEEIARLAAVGVGTLYRRFPDREALVIAVVQDSLATMLARLRACAAHQTATGAWETLVSGLGDPRELRLTMRLTSLFSPAASTAVQADPMIGQIRREYSELFEGVVRAAQAEGSLRADVGAGDVAHLLSLLAHALSRGPDETAEIAFERARAIVLDGLRAQPTIPLPGRPLTTADLTRE